ncbi:MAG: hypothetical protein IKA82_01240 [Clostridia bacterium]|nr:hypothetical protein [Clostridia bacterium]
MIKKFGIIVLSIVMILSAVAFSGCTEEKTYSTEFDPMRATVYGGNSFESGVYAYLFGLSRGKLVPNAFEALENVDVDVLDEIKVFGVKYELEYLYSGHARRYGTELDVYQVKGDEYRNIIVNRRTGKVDKLRLTKPEVNEDKLKTEEECREIAIKFLRTRVKSLNNYMIEFREQQGYYVVNATHKADSFATLDWGGVSIAKDGTIFSYEVIGFGAMEDFSTDIVIFPEEIEQYVNSKIDSYVRRGRLTIAPQHEGGQISEVSASTPGISPLFRDLDGNLVVGVSGLLFGKETCTTDDGSVTSPHDVHDHYYIRFNLGCFPEVEAYEKEGENEKTYSNNINNCTFYRTAFCCNLGRRRICTSI